MPQITRTIHQTYPGCFTNIREIPVPVDLKFSAPLPGWLHGVLFSVGPGIFDFPKGSVGCWLDGMAMVTKFELGGDNLRVTSRIVATNCYKNATRAQRPVCNGLHTPPGEDENRGFFSKLRPFQPSNISDNCIGIVNRLNSKYYILADSSTCYEIDPKTLDTLGSFNSQKIFGLSSICPEIAIDQTNGDRYLVGSAINPTFHNIILKMPASNKDQPLDKQFEKLTSIPSRWRFGPCGIRKCFAITENFVVFIEVPFIVNLVKVAATFIKRYTMLDWLDWMPDDKTRFYVVGKKTGKIVKTEYLSAKAFLVTEIVNAYEERGKIILDLCTQPNPTIFQGVTLSNMRNLLSPPDYTPGLLERYSLPLIKDCRRYSILPPEAKKGSIRKGENTLVLSPTLISNNPNCVGFDSGIINPNYAQTAHSFVYVISNFPTTFSHNKNAKISHGIAKVHLEDGKISSNKEFWGCGDGYFPMVPIFIPKNQRENGESEGKEDDGVLLTLVQNLYNRGCDYLVVLDAGNMSEIARAEFGHMQIAAWLQTTFFSEL